MARSTYATWRQDPYLDRDKDEEAFPVGNDEDIFEDGLNKRYTQTTVQREAYETDMGSDKERYITENLWKGLSQILSLLVMMSHIKPE
jgi:hypothetical protein